MIYINIVKPVARLGSSVILVTTMSTSPFGSEMPVKNDPKTCTFGEPEEIPRDNDKYNNAKDNYDGNTTNNNPITYPHRPALPPALKTARRLVTHLK